jgi:hypothetical protein
LGLFLLPKVRPGRRFMDADDDEATREVSFGLFLLPRGRPRPYFSITAPVSRSTTPTSAIGRFCLAKRNPRWDLEEEDDNERIRVFPAKLAYLIYKWPFVGLYELQVQLKLRALTFHPEERKE